MGRHKVLRQNDHESLVGPFTSEKRCVTYGASWDDFTSLDIFIARCQAVPLIWATLYLSHRAIGTILPTPVTVIQYAIQSLTFLGRYPSCNTIIPGAAAANFRDKRQTNFRARMRAKKGEGEEGYCQDFGLICVWFAETRGVASRSHAFII